MFNGIWRDLVYAGRSLTKARAFTFMLMFSQNGIVQAAVVDLNDIVTPDAGRVVLTRP